MRTDTEAFHKNLVLAQYAGGEHEKGTAYVRFPDFGENVYINDSPHPTEEPVWDPANELRHITMVEQELDDDQLREAYLDRLREEGEEGEWGMLQLPLSKRAEVAYGLLCEVAALLDSK